MPPTGAAAALLAAALACGTAAARTIVVGEGGDVPTLAEAARRATDGDVLSLKPGEYFECAALSQHRLTIQGPGAVLTDRACEGKAILVLRGNGTTVRDLKLARARVPDGNGAGIRLEGRSLTLEHVTFENNQVALLAGGDAGQVQISGSRFSRNGVPGSTNLATVMVGGAALLRIEASVFEQGRGSQIASGAARTELVGNRIANGSEPPGAQSLTISGDALFMQDNVLLLGPAPPPRNAAVLATGARAELRGNRLENSTGQPQTLLLDWTSSTPVLAGNVVAHNDTEVSTTGSWRRHASEAAHTAIDSARGAAGAVKRGIKDLLGW